MSNRKRPAVRNFDLFGVVELLPCLDVDKLNPFPVSRTIVLSPTWMIQGGVPEWLKGTGCKPVGVSLRWFESNPLHQLVERGREALERMIGSYVDGKQECRNVRV